MDEAVIILAADGHVTDASAPALELLGVALPALRALPPGSLSALGMEERQAMREAVIGSASEALAGQLPIRRVDGSTVHVRFVLDKLEDGGWRAVLEEAPEETGPMQMYSSAGEILSAWRAAERRLEEIAPGSADWTALQEQITSFRDEYKRHFRMQLPPATD